MTENDLDDGRLVCLIEVALLRPAEFVIFRIASRWQSSGYGSDPVRIPPPGHSSDRHPSTPRRLLPRWTGATAPARTDRDWPSAVSDAAAFDG